jgi:hypothetical protein
MTRLILLTALALSACSAHQLAYNPEPAVPPALVLGRFTDDYDNQYDITATDWIQLPHGRFHVVKWNPDEQYLIAQNDSSNSNAPGKWTRIDWMEFPGMEPFTWGFCLSAYDAGTRREAEASAIAQRSTPRTGCNSYPFSRMKRKADDR